jgi:hypothetical protein
VTTRVGLSAAIFIFFKEKNKRISLQSTLEKHYFVQFKSFKTIKQLEDFKNENTTSLSSELGKKNLQLRCTSAKP